MMNAPDTMDEIYTYYDGDYPTCGDWRCKFTGKVCGKDCTKCNLPLIWPDKALAILKGVE